MNSLSTCERGGASGKNDNLTAADPIWGPAFKGSDEVAQYLRMQYGQMFLMRDYNGHKRGWVAMIQWYNNGDRYYRLHAEHVFYQSAIFIAAGEPS